MNFIKFRGKILRVELTPKEQKALDENTRQYVLALHQKFGDDVDYMIMRILHNHFGFGLSRLRRFYEAFRVDNAALVKHYEMEDAGAYIARKEMNELGCNIEEWNKERSD